MIKERKKIIYYCTHSNLKDLSYGDSNNDNKFIQKEMKKEQLVYFHYLK
jgi:hypothetical protein